MPARISPLLATWLYSDIASTPSSLASLRMLSASIPSASASSIAARRTRSLLRGVRALLRARRFAWPYAVSVRASDGDDDLPPGVSFAQVPERVGHLAQLEAPVDDGLHRSVREQLAHEREVLLRDLGDEVDHALASTQ